MSLTRGFWSRMPPQDDLAFQARLRQLRQRHQLSQTAASRILGMSQKYWSNWETGACRPDLKSLTRIRAAFGVSLDWLLTGEELAQARPDLADRADGGDPADA